MIINNVKINNFKIHKNKSISFTQGLNTIGGPNYSGKSTILQAIIYALYGTSAVECKTEFLATTGSTGKASVSLEFSVVGTNYLIDRKGGSVTLSKEGEVLSRSTGDVANELHKILGLTKTQFLKTRLSRQGDTQALLSTGSQELKKLVEGLSGYTVVDEIYKVAGAKVKELNTSKEYISSMLSIPEGYSRADILDKFEKDLTILSLDLVAKEADLTRSTTKAEEIKEEASELSTKYAKAKKIEKANKAAIKERGESEAKLELLKSQNKELALTYDIDPVNIGDMKTKLDVLNHRWNKYSQANQGYELVAREVGKLEIELERVISLLQDTVIVEVDIKALDEANTKLSEYASKVSEKSKEISVLKKEKKSGVCVACSRPFDGSKDQSYYDTRIEKLNAELSVLRGEESELRFMVDKLDSEFKIYRVAMSETARLSDLKAELELEVASKEEELREIAQIIDNLDAVGESEVSDYKAEINVLESKAREYSLTKQKIKELESSLKSIVIVDTIEDTEGLSVSLEEKRSELMECSESVSKLKLEVQKTGFELEGCRNKSEATSKLLSKINELDEGLDGYLDIYKVIKDNRSTMMGQVWKGLLESASDFVSTCTDGDVTDIDIDDKFSIVYKEKSVVYPISSASGAQKSLIGLGIRLAIANLLPNNVDVLLLDEVSADMEESISAVAVRVLRDQCVQAISVSHRKEDATTSDNIIQLTRG